MIMETGQSPAPYFILREVHYEQLSVQRIRQQQLDLDHSHRPPVPLLLRRLLRPSRAACEGIQPHGRIGEPHGFVELPHFCVFYGFFQKTLEIRCVFPENVL